ncbi:MAG: CotH kinase family protein [Clostridia bacterium]|nr:CotH kinase family protein [Clostridia bacterium]
MNKQKLIRIIYIATIVACVGIAVAVALLTDVPDATHDVTQDSTATPFVSETPVSTPTATPEVSPTPTATPIATPTPTPEATVTPAPVCKETIKSFRLTAKDNTGLKSEVVFQVNGTKITATVSYLVNRNVLTSARPTIDAGNGKVTFNSEAVNSDGSLNLSAPCICTVTDKDGQTRDYEVEVIYLKNELPIVYLTTDSGLAVTSKEQYVTGTFSLDCTDSFMSQYLNINGKVIQIRGRGQSSWEQFDKKSYKIKFDTKTEVLGMTPNKKWVLIANHPDKTLMQNHIAMTMGSVLDNLAFTPHQYLVDVFFNGEYLGVYTIGEQLEVKNGRVDIEPEEGDESLAFLIELGGRDDDALNPPKYYTVGYLRNFTIHYPEEEVISSNDVSRIKNYLRQCDNAVKYLQDYEEYIDVDSLIDWIICYEMTYNLDGCMRRSCYMVLEPGGKLKMGPIWDFDLAFGNFHRYTEGTWATLGSAADDTYVKLNWVNCLVADPEFMDRLRARWDEIKDQLLADMLAEVDYTYQVTKPSATLNFQKWDVLGTRLFGQPYSTVNYKTYDAQVKRLRDYIIDRWNWLDGQDWNMPLTDF